MKRKGSVPLAALKLLKCEQPSTLIFPPSCDFRATQTSCELRVRFITKMLNKGYAQSNSIRQCLRTCGVVDLHFRFLCFDSWKGWTVKTLLILPARHSSISNQPEFIIHVWTCFQQVDTFIETLQSTVANLLLLKKFSHTFWTNFSR